MKRRSRLINFLFLCCYVPYSILPLNYAVEGSIERSRSGAPASVLQEVEQNVVEIVLAGVVPDVPEKDGSPASTRVLLRKKRALSVSSKDLLARPLVWSTAHAQDPYAEVSSRIDASQLQGPVQNCGHRSCCSGTAPPAAGYAL